jgi:PAS domain S-box-containing protein
MFGFGKKENKANSKGSLATNLHDEQAKSEIILNAIDDGVILIDSEHVIHLFNRGAAAITGWRQQDALGLNCASVIKLVNEKNEPYTKEQDPFNNVFQQKTSIHDDNANLVTVSGTKIVAISLSVSPLLDQNNNVTGAVGVFRDVTNQRQEEKQQAEFISTASHEMRTPVAAIEGYLALAMNDKVAQIDSKAREYLEKAHMSTQHLGKLFQDLLTSAKAEGGRLQNHPVIVEVGTFLEQLVDGIRFTAEKKNLIAEYLIGASDKQLVDNRHPEQQKLVRPLYYISADPDRLREALVNIYDNAVKYTETGKITVGLAGDNDVVQIRIQDTGAGIPAEDIPHLFEKFYRVDTSKTRTVGGTGLGLFICRKIIELYNGRVWVESELGKGSTFYINLPRISSDKAQALLAKETANNIIQPLNDNLTSIPNP